MGDTYEGKIAWITGGGTGIGRGLAVEMARGGATVVVSGRREDKLAEAVADIEAVGGRGLARVCDVTDEAEIRDTIAAVVEAYGKLDIVVANAGYGTQVRFEDLEADILRRQLDVNVIGAAMTVRHAIPELRKTQGRASFVSSVAGMLVYPGGAAYCASKFAVRALGLAVSTELAGTGVSCTTVYPGFVESEIFQVDNRGRLREGMKDKRPEKLMWPTDKAARVMAKAILARKREYVFTGHGKVGAWLGRHLPGLSYGLIANHQSKQNRRRALRVAKGSTD